MGVSCIGPALEPMWRLEHGERQVQQLSCGRHSIVTKYLRGAMMCSPGYRIAIRAWIELRARMSVG